MAAQAAEMAAAIGDTGNATALTALHKQLVGQFNDCFDAKATGVYDTGIMTADVLALQLGAPDAASTTNATRKHLLANVQSAENHFTTGIIGFKFLFDQLAAAGSADVALAVLEQTTYPAIGYSATNTLEPATSNVWELPDAPFEGTGMNSRNHHMCVRASVHAAPCVLRCAKRAGERARGGRGQSKQPGVRPLGVGLTTPPPPPPHHHHYPLLHHRHYRRTTLPKVLKLFHLPAPERRWSAPFLRSGVQVDGARCERALLGGVLLALVRAGPPRRDCQPAPAARHRVAGLAAPRRRAVRPGK
jgi:hypothetical protein